MWRRWRSTGGTVKQSVSALFSQVYGRKTRPPHPSHTLGLRAIVLATSLRSRPSSTSPYADSNSGDSNRNDMSFAETKKLMRLVTVEALKRKLGMEGKEFIGYSELLQACESKVYLHPQTGVRGSVKTTGLRGSDFRYGGEKGLDRVGESEGSVKLKMKYAGNAYEFRE